MSRDEFDQDTANKVWRIIRKYCRHHPFHSSNGPVPMRCMPSRAELESGYPVKSAYKIIYDSWDAAQRAAQEIFQLTGHRTNAYTCHRSPRKRHKHLTTDEKWMQKHPDRDKRSE